jgi:hypothetical protein
LIDQAILRSGPGAIAHCTKSQALRSVAALDENVAITFMKMNAI